ncbi:MAG TPA: hypothetical protein VK053_17385 [Jiangellaceae bacterium]|nr:hypothetical protein [Jiangellaceae bacterium]
MRTRRIDVLSLVMGLLFVGVVVMWSLFSAGLLSLPGLTVAAPVVLVAAGLAGVLATLRPNRRISHD